MVNNCDSERDGNTVTHLSPASNKERKQYKYWFLTWNDYKNETMETLEITFEVLKQMCAWYIIQEERGESGNEHLQGTIYFKDKQRFSCLKKIHRSIHWEETKQVSSSIAYCSRESKRVGRIWCHNFTLPYTCKVSQPYGWQLQVMDIVNTIPDDRTIHWFWEPHGNVGKTTLCKYLVVKYNALMLSGGKSSDMYHMISKFPDKRYIIIIDIPRSSKDYINYGAIEQIKNGLIFSGKYEGAQLVFDCPHVICFANSPPDRMSMSIDRWNIIMINPTQ